MNELRESVYIHIYIYILAQTSILRSNIILCVFLGVFVRKFAELEDVIGNHLSLTRDVRDDLKNLKVP